MKKPNCLKKGDKINIFIKDTNNENEEFNKAYIENIEIENFKDSKRKVISNINEIQYIEVKIPFKYYGLTSTISFYPSISFNITKTSSNSKLKINTKLYEILDEFYRVKNEN